MQREFIDIAAHELRTPIQPILGLAETLYSHTNDPEQAKSLEVIRRDAKRLMRLSADILDVTRIEGKSLELKEEVMPKLFSKFVSTSFTGTGLGLFISKSIVEAHGGDMWAGNNADGKGATFTFSLPIREQKS